MKTDTTKIKSGDILAVTYWVKVEETARSGSEIHVTDLERGSDFSIRGAELIESAFSADQFTEEKKDSMTNVATLFVNSERKPLTVCFTKEDGTERVLRGRLIKADPVLGSSMVEDFDQPLGKGIRKLYHTSIKWLIVDGVKHTVK
jgi:hypothetical protein